VKFNFYIADTLNGEIIGTNSKAIAEDYASSDDYFVVEAETGRWILPGNDSVEVKAFKEVQL
jgi:hypothetical protein